VIREWKVWRPRHDLNDTGGPRQWNLAHEPWGSIEVPAMTHVEEEKVTTTYEKVDPPEPKVVNLNVNSGGETISIDTPDEPTQTETETTTTHSEVRQSR
jgi:hypothetical protein